MSEREHVQGSGAGAATAAEDTRDGGRALRHGGLGVEAFAVALAHAEHFRPDEGIELRRRLSVGEDAWREAVRGFGLALADAARDPGGPLVTAFARAFGASAADLRTRRPALAEVAPLSEARPRGEPGARAAPHPPGTADMTLAEDGGAASEPALPFTGAPSEAFLSELARHHRAPSRWASERDTTAEVPAILGDLDTTLPFASKEIAAHDERLRATLSLEQYASFNAELVVHPERAEHTRSRYGIADLRTHRRLERAWTEHLKREPAEAEHFGVLLQRFIVWLRRER